MNFDRTGRLVLKNLRIASWVLSKESWDGRFNGPKVLVNSVPKCGTNLVQEMVQNWPGMRGSITRTKGGPWEGESDRLIGRISKGTCVTSHYHYSTCLAEHCRARNVKVIHVVRDFRDALLSHINFIGKIGESHKHGVLFNEATSFDDKIDMCLDGVPGILLGWKDMLPLYNGWLDSGAHILRYEELCKSDFYEDGGVGLKNIAELSKYLEVDMPEIEKIQRVTNQSSGLTYNSPGINKWKKGFSAKQQAKVNLVLEPHLRLWGYDLG